jgi:hypothetical protein
MHDSNDSPLPIEAWSADMSAAIDQIREIGQHTLETHRAASDKAAESAEHWKLAERQKDERAALHQLFGSSRLIIEAVEDTRQLMRADDVAVATLHESMHATAAAIESNLANIEEAFLTIRHCALDLLRWTGRAGRIDDSELPSQYRASYARLIAYTPVFKPRLEAMQDELLALREGADVHPDVQLLLSALTRFNAVADTARGFVKSVVEPPLELVFQDTDTLHSDRQKYTTADQRRMATEFNDCCQLLLYDRAEFDRRVEHIRPQLPDGVEASLYVLAADKVRVIFTVDEDPMFEQLTVTLLRVVDKSDCDSAIASVVQDLYSELSDE